MKDRKTICEKATEKIKKLLTGEPTDKFQKRVQERLNSLLNEELEFASDEKNNELSDEETYKHFDDAFTDVIDRLITMITSEISYCEEYDIDYPESLEDIKFADIGLADWFKITIDIHTENIEKKLGIHRFSINSKDDFDKAVVEILKTLFSEE